MNSVLEAADRVRQVSTGELVVLDITRDGEVTVDEMLVYAQSSRRWGPSSLTGSSATASFPMASTWATRSTLTGRCAGSSTTSTRRPRESRRFVFARGGQLIGRRSGGRDRSVRR
jgi:hypothetical protein